jgi:hypothetical protein
MRYETECISFKELMKRMWQGEAFDLEIVTYNTSRKTGGDIKLYTQARLNIKVEDKYKSSRPERESIEIELRVYYTPQPRINIVLQNTEIRTIYKVGIIRANNLEVML